MSTAVAGWVDITPARPLPMAGFGERLENYDAIHDGIEANIILFRSTDPAGELTALISLDLLYAGDLVKLISAWATERNLKVQLCASHTHNAPASDSDRPRLGAVNQAWLTRSAQSICDELQRLSALIEPSATKPADRLDASESSIASLISARTLSHSYAIRRRRKGMKLVRKGRWPRLYRGIKNAPDRVSEASPTIDVISIGSPQDPVAVIWRAACHPTSAPWRSELSAEYPGAVRKAIRQRFGGIPVLFLQGGAGDVRPLVSAPNGLERLKLEMTEALTGRPPWRLPSVREWESWVDGLAAAVIADCFPTDGAVEGPHALAVRSSQAAGPIESLFQSGQQPARSKPVELRCQVLQLSEQVSLAGFNVELMNDHHAILEGTLGAKTAVIYGYADEVFGYWPTSKMVSQGGYEVDGHHASFGLSGTLPLNPDRVICGLSQHAWSLTDVQFLKTRPS